MTERFIREAIDDPVHAIDALRLCVRTGDFEGFERVCAAHARARDLAETVEVIDFGDLRLWHQIDHGKHYAWADIALIQTDYVRFYPVRHYTNAPAHLRAQSSTQNTPCTLLWQIMGNALLELERQRAIKALLEAEKAEDEWGMFAQAEEREAFYLRLEEHAHLHNLPSNYTQMTLEHIRLWHAWTTDPEQPWNKKNT